MSMTNDELRLYNSFKNATPAQQETFTEDDWKEAERLSNLYKAEQKLPEVSKDTVSDYSFVGFAEPTTREKAEAYVKANNPSAIDSAYMAQSDADKDLANERARQYGNEGGNAYTLARDMFSIPVGALMASLEYGKDKIFGEGGQVTGHKPWSDYYKEALKLGNEGEGATGVVSDPLNAAFLAPGLGEKTIKMVGLNPMGVWGNRAVRTAGGIGEGLGYAIASDIGNGRIGTGNETDVSSVAIPYAIGAGLGGLTGLAGSSLRQTGRERFPGVFTGNPKSIDASERRALQENLDNFLDQGIIPKGRHGFEQMSDYETTKLGKVYDEAIRAATPFTYAVGGDNSDLYYRGALEQRDNLLRMARKTRDPGDIFVNNRIIESRGKSVGNNVKNPTEAYHIYEVRTGDPMPSSMVPEGTTQPLLVPMSDIRTEVERRFKDKLAASDILSDKNLKKLEKSQESAIASIRHRQNLKETISEYLNLPNNPSDEDISTAISELAKTDPSSAETYSKLWNDPVYEAAEVSKFRNNTNDPAMYRDPTKSGETQMTKRHLATSYRDAINDILGSDPRYAAHVTPEVRRNYGLYKALGEVVDAPGAIGLTSRLPWGQAVSPWRTSSLYYKTGKLLERSTPAIPRIIDWTQAIRQSQDNKK